MKAPERIYGWSKNATLVCACQSKMCKKADCRKYSLSGSERKRELRSLRKWINNTRSDMMDSISIVAEIDRRLLKKGG